MSQLKPQEIVRLGDIQMANHLPFVLFGGMNVLESKTLLLKLLKPMWISANAWIFLCV
jgi:3-deoxy-D-manno-octulosonic acid (KDO) 8-phosphate synthase